MAVTVFSQAGMGHLCHSHSRCQVISVSSTDIKMKLLQVLKKNKLIDKKGPKRLSVLPGCQLHFNVQTQEKHRGG